MKSSSQFLQLLSLLIILLSITPRANSDEPLNKFCRADASYAANSTFQANLDLVLSSLPSAAAPSGFANTTVGRAGPDQVHGLALCRGDISPADCLTCLKNATKDIVAECPHDAGSTIWYDECMLRYDNLSIVSVLNMSSFYECIPNPNNVAQPQVFDELLGQLMDTVTTTAAQSPQMFAFGEVNFTESNKIYGMAQCTRDLDSIDCFTCLTDYVGFIPRCCGGKEGGRLFGSNCGIRYEFFQFYNSSAVHTVAVQNVTAPPPPTPAGHAPSSSGNGKHKPKLVLITTIPVGTGAAIVLFGLCIYLLMRKQGRDAQNMKIRSKSFDLKTLCTATNNFSIQNKLGSGGAGMVYKGTLPDGQEIAVKRFSGALHQGITELAFIVLIAMVEHPNLVKLIGFCYEKMEMLLVCEYLPNKSLDNYLFDPNRRAQLDWRTRYMIVRGVCRGLLYLHEDSQLTIIHRDLKASNILLDKDMNPKIADFGLAKLLGRDRTHEITRKNAGTLGYMAPEYYNKGQFSKQSDVFSYGILVLEIVTGERNSEFEGSGDALYLSTYVWKHWRNGKGLDVVDKSFGNLYEQDEALKCIQIGLLCAQHDRAKRPSMSQVSSMLDGPNEISEQPCEPGYTPVLDNTTVISSPEQEHALFNTYRDVQERQTV